MDLHEDCWSEFKIKVNAIMHFLSENYTTFNNSIIKGYVYITKYGIFFRLKWLDSINLLFLILSKPF